MLQFNWILLECYFAIFSWIGLSLESLESPKVWFLIRMKPNRHHDCCETSPEKVYQAEQTSLFCLHWEVSKDTVNRETLWAVLRFQGCPRKFMKLIHLLYDGMTKLAIYNGDMSAAFAISNGVRQDFLLIPVLFNLFFACCLHVIRCCPGSEGGSILQISIWLSLILQLECTDKVSPNSHSRKPLCWWPWIPGT